MFYVYEIRETDGNDARVYNCVIEGETKEKAGETLSSYFQKEASEKGWDHDGNFCGYFFPCDCEVPEMPEEVIPCPQCSMLSINGIPCHERGCPIDRERARVQKAIDRFECLGHGGLTVSESPEEYASEEEAVESIPSYHSRYYI
jgi:hypothetical protein